MAIRLQMLMASLAFTLIGAGCSRSAPNSKPSAPTHTAHTSGLGTDATVHADRPSNSSGASYVPPTDEEMAPMRPEYLAELAKIHEPPEMGDKSMQVRKAASPNMAKLGNVISAIASPEKATHQQRVTAIRELLEIVNNAEQDDGVDKGMTYGVLAVMACLDGADPQTVIGYANNSTDSNGDGLALRARMYLRAGDKTRALDDLEKVMASGDGHALAGGGVDPLKDSARCGWSIADFDAFGDDPRALAGKGLYLSSFIAYGAEDRGTVKESTIRDLYARSAASWHSPIPQFLKVSIDGFGSPHTMNGAHCIRAKDTMFAAPETVNACAMYDEEIQQEIRELTMALVIEPSFVPALSERASKYLQLAQGFYADRKPSRQLFESAIKDYNAAISAGDKNEHTVYCDRGLALASIGQYQDAAAGYLQGMQHAKNGVEESSFVYEQLANLYMKLGKFNAAADLLTQAIMHTSGGGMDIVILGGGMKAFRTLYPEYDSLPDEILAEVVRRRYHPQFPQSWDADFISKAGFFNGKIASSILVELFVMRGDAYAKAGRRAEALADYRRVKSDAWSGDEPSLPRHMYFNDRGMRIFDMPERWPPPPATM
jgi:tetratricopeptide (TPR) repeat protein